MASSDWAFDTKRLPGSLHFRTPQQMLAALRPDDEMGHIQRRKDRPGWRARYVGLDGHERSRTFRRKADAERFLTQVEADKVRGEWADPKLGKITFAEWSGEWLRTAVHRKPKTRAGHESAKSSATMPPAAVPIKWKRSMPSASTSARKSSAGSACGASGATSVRPDCRRS